MNGFNDRIAMGPPNLILTYGLRFQYAEEYVNNKNALHAERSGNVIFWEFEKIKIEILIYPKKNKDNYLCIYKIIRNHIFL